MLSFLSEPSYPNAAIGIESDSITALALEKHGKGEFGIKQVATVPLSQGTVTPSFLEINIPDTSSFGERLEEAVASAGLLKQKAWSIALPSNTARSAILTLEAEPAKKSEADEILDWKAEQSFGAPAADLRISRQSITRDRDGRARYFATAIKLSVIDEYENVFERLGWKAGLILPRSVSEINWLMGPEGQGDAMLISGQNDGFTALLLRSNEPTVVRSVTCDPAEVDDEIYRLLMFYNDRYGRELGSTLDRLLVTGRTIIPAKVREIAADALDHATRIVTSDEVGLRLPDRTFTFDELAAPAGLAALA
jgi:hypothetical protein